MLKTREEAPEHVEAVQAAGAGEGVDAAVVIALLAKTGDQVAADQIVAELENDKATAELPLPFAGVVREVHKKVGDEIRVGEPLLSIEVDGSGDGASAPETESEGRSSEDTEPKEADPTPDESTATGSATENPEPDGGEPRASSTAQSTPMSLVSGGGSRSKEVLPAGPEVRRLARELGVGLHEVTGTGPRERITPEDVRAYTRSRLQSASPRGQGEETQNVAVPAPLLPDFTKWGEVEARPMTGVRRKTAEVVASLTGGLGQLAKARKIRYLRARGRLRDERTVALDNETGGISTVGFNTLILATGSAPNRLPHAPETKRIWSSDDALTLPEIPARLLVIGGGYIGLELGTIYAALGSNVSVIEVADALLPGVDPDLTRPLKKRLDSQFEEIRLETKVTAFEEREDGLEVGLVSTRDGGGEPKREQFDRCLVAVGRRPNTANIGLEAAGVELDDRGFVKTDDHLRTTQSGIFAIGDVTGPPMLAHTATHQGRTVVEAIHGKDVVYAPRAFPAVVFTDPEIAWCGLTEQEAKARALDVRILRFPHAASGRAKTLGDTAGLTKIVAESDTGHILGAGIVGPDAGELIGEAVLAVEMGATAMDLALTIHPHPTMSETLMEAAEAYAGHCTHYRTSGAR